MRITARSSKLSSFGFPSNASTSRLWANRDIPLSPLKKTSLPDSFRSVTPARIVVTAHEGEPDQHERDRPKTKKNVAPQFELACKHHACNQVYSDESNRKKPRPEDPCPPSGSLSV
jgi:hypothetical protein